MAVSYISWASDCSRSDYTARELNGTSHMVYWESLGSRPSTVWLKYIGQAFRTWWILAGDKPSAVFVMTPPVFAVAAVWLFSRLRRVPIVVDAHTAAFLHPRWKYLQRVQYWFCRRAATTLVTNEHLADAVRSHGGHATIVPDIPVRFPDGHYPLSSGAAANVAVVCSFNPDEPIEEILRAAERLPDVHFHMTGRAPETHRKAAPANVTFTGFLSTGAYGSLLQKADAVMSLTTRDHTMLRGAWEAIYQGTPVIVSDWPILREAFDQGALHVDNSPEAIAQAVRTIVEQRDDYRSAAGLLRVRKETRWSATREQILQRLTPQ